ncbi:MAG: zinc ribbon domain-containing protein [Ruminococcus sp.]|nr:zinc ribbon domain-containing protein [Ruminococcus sp.]
MKAKDIYFKTMKFVWLKLALGAAITAAATILLAIFMLIGNAIGGGGGMYIMLLIWLASVAVIYKLAMSYIGYMLKAGHVAVIASAVTTGQLPDDQFEYGKQMVKSRFAASNVYFVVDRLVSGAVRQLQKIVGKTGDFLSVVPGMTAVTGFIQTFIGIALGYVDECCLGYCFLKSEDGAFKASCDGVVIYFQNAKKLLKDAAITTLIVMALTLASWVVPLVIFIGIFQMFHWNIFAAVLLAIIVAAVLKSAFIDSWMMVKMMVSYMEVAPSTQITFDLYSKLSGLSNKFKELFNKAKQEGPINVSPAPAMAYGASINGVSNQQQNSTSNVQDEHTAQPASTSFCGQCGTPISDGKFCPKCGASVK